MTEPDDKQVRRGIDTRSLLFTSIPVGIVIQDEDGHIAAANPAAEHILGLTLEQLRTRSSEDPRWRSVHEDGSEFPGDDHPSMIALRTGTSVHGVLMGVHNPVLDQCRWIRIDATPVILAAGEPPCQVYTTFEDVTELRSAELALRETAARYRIVADNTFDWEWWRDPAGDFVYCSPGCEEITGYAPEVFMQDPARLLEIVHPRDRETLRTHLELDLSELPGVAAVEFRLTTRDGHECVIAPDCRPVYGDNGEWLGRRASNRDVTEQRRAETEVERLNEELRRRVVSRTEQLDATTRELEALAYALAHDIRAPLRTIDGFSALVVEDEGERLSPDGRAALARVRSAAQNLARLLDELMGLSHVSRRELARRLVDLTALAEAVGAEMAEEHPSRAVELTVAPGLVAFADPDLTRVILRELLDNAWKFTAPNPVAHVRVGATQGDGDESVFSVRDDGVGFDPHHAEHLFGVFQRLHPPGQFEGDGVGLATVQRLVRRHGGRAWADSSPGRGTTVHFTLPPGETATREE